MQRKTVLVLICLFGLFITSFQTQAFIRRHYRLEEVIKECTHIVFGTVTEVSQKRMTAKVKVVENLKGKSDFQEMKINIGVGQGNFPQQLIKQFKTGLPIIVFYKKEGQRLMSLGHINGTWFQTFGQDRSDKSRVWWNMTHIEIYMHRTYNGTTPDFQKLLRDVLAGKTRSKKSKTQNLIEAPSSAVRVLVLTGKHFDVEFDVLSRFDQSNGQKVVYQKTKGRNLPDLEHADVLWIGQGAISEGRYFLKAEQENKIKAFVNDGGVVIVSGQDSDSKRPCRTGWIPEPMKGVDRNGHSDFQPTQAAGRLFREPNVIKSGKVFIDDTWTDWSDKYTILATTNRGKDIAVAMLKYGKGMYLIMGFQNETTANISVNRPMLENLIHFTIGWRKNRS